MRETLKELVDKKIADMLEQDKKLTEEKIDRNTVEVKWPAKIMATAYRWKLRQNACKNRGFVLDNFPKS